MARRGAPRREQKAKPWRRRKADPGRGKRATDVSCPTGKPAFPSEEVAEEVLREIHEGPEARAAGVKPQRSYPCEQCGLHHLTSRLSHKGRRYEPYGSRKGSPEEDRRAADA